MAQNNVINKYPNGGPIQVIYAVNGGRTTSTITPTDITGATATITPANVNNVIVVIANLAVQIPANSSEVYNIAFIQLVRNAMNINGTPTLRIDSGTNVNFTSDSFYNASSILYVDSPASISPVTYKLQQYASASVGGLNNLTTANVSLILMEFAS